MSYETNPILNRIKILKGWKHSTFPTKTLNYSGEMVLWFKVYLFLKVYLWCKNIRLLTCDIRSSENNTKLLYLSVSKHLTKKKYRKSKWKTKSFLQKLKSSLTKTKNKKARFLLYRDLRTLKHKSDFFLNMNREKIVSKAWFSKKRLSSWLNFSQDIRFQREIRKNQYNLIRKKKIFGFQKQKSKWVAGSTIPQKILLWKKAKKNLLGLLVKFQKDVFFLKKLFQSLPSKNAPPKSLQHFLSYLIKQYLIRRKFLKEIEALYELFLTDELENIITTPLKHLTRPFAARILKKKVRKQLKSSWIRLRKQWEILKNQPVFCFSKKRQISLFKRSLWKNMFFLFLNASEKNILVQNWRTGSVFTQIEKLLSSHKFRSVMLSPSIRIFKRPRKIRWKRVFKLLRFEQKKKLHAYKKKEFSNFSQKVRLTNNMGDISLPTKTAIQKVSYRLSSRYNYRQHLTLTTNLKLKYLIENLINKYFSFVVSVKIMWPLIQFKNLKFYRLIFPAYKHKKKKLPWTLTKNVRVTNKRYLYIGKYTNHLKIQEKFCRSSKKSVLARNFYEQKIEKFLDSTNGWKHKLETTLNKHTIILNSPQTWTKYQKQSISATLSNLWKKKLKKKNKYLILKAKIMQSKNENRLFWASKQSFISNLTTTLTLLTKYLDPQPLADHLAKIIGNTKNHASILKIVKNVLRTLRFKRGLGYRIALSGRINGTNKSRTFYLKKLNQNRSRQTFSKNVNFAMSQARATIGAFGIKIWVYS